MEHPGKIEQPLVATPLQTPLSHSAPKRLERDGPPRGMLKEDELALGTDDPAGIALLDPERRHGRVEDHDVARLVVAEVGPLRGGEMPVHKADFPC